MYEVEWRINKRRKKQIIKQKNRHAEIFILGNKNEKKKKRAKKENEDNVYNQKGERRGEERGGGEG